MIITSKVLIPNKEWLIETKEGKIGSIAKSKKGYSFLQKGKRVSFNNINEIKKEFGWDILKKELDTQSKTDTQVYSIYDYPCSSKPHNPVFNLRKKLPLFTKSKKSKSQFCAGYYIVKFRKGWTKSFCPKVITLDRYPYHGPFKTEIEMKNELIKFNKLIAKDETT